MLPKPIKNLVRAALIRKPPGHLSRNFREIAGHDLEAVANSLRKHYFAQKQNHFADTPEAYLASEEGRRDFQNHLLGRLNGDRRTVVPWLDDARPLRGARLLEIGCGTGASTVALAEQGASVSAVDISESSLVVARDRCSAYGLGADFARANATEVHSVFEGKKFDCIIFFATLEHMTHEERIVAMRRTWAMLSPGGLWCVIETPNRLWYFDGHTSLLPFYLWLPDDLAFEYSRFSPRESFRTLYGEQAEGLRTDFLRRGRGVSFHEFDLTLGRSENLRVLSSLRSFLRSRNVLWGIRRRFSDEYRFETFLRKQGPPVHEGFYQPYLDLIIEKV